MERYIGDRFCLHGKDYVVEKDNGQEGILACEGCVFHLNVEEKCNGDSVLKIRGICSNTGFIFTEKGPARIANVEDLCNNLGFTLDEAETAQETLEATLDYLYSVGVVDKYSEDRLDWLFSDEQTD